MAQLDGLAVGGGPVGVRGVGVPPAGGFVEGDSRRAVFVRDVQREVVSMLGGPGPDVVDECAGERTAAGGRGDEEPGKFDVASRRFAVWALDRDVTVDAALSPFGDPCLEQPWWVEPVARVCWPVQGVCIGFLT